jgi:hypothetical protein
MLTKPSRQNSRKKGIGTDWILNALEGLPSICLIVRRFLWYLKGLQPSSPLHSRRLGEKDLSWALSLRGWPRPIYAKWSWVTARGQPRCPKCRACQRWVGLGAQWTLMLTFLLCRCFCSAGHWTQGLVPIAKHECSTAWAVPQVFCLLLLFLFYFMFLVVLGCEFRVSLLQAGDHLSHAPSPFCSSYFFR